MKTVFLSAPTSSTVEDGKLSVYFKTVIAKLMDSHPDILFVSPMFYFETANYMKTPPTFDNWKARCFEMIERADELWVLKFDGWEQSYGVSQEVVYAQQLYIRREIKYINIWEI